MVVGLVKAPDGKLEVPDGILKLADGVPVAPILATGELAELPTSIAFLFGTNLAETQPAGTAPNTISSALSETQNVAPGYVTSKPDTMKAAESGLPRPCANFFTCEAPLADKAPRVS